MFEIHRAIRDAIDRARSKGVLFVVAAGNSGYNLDRDPEFPASFDLDNIISVTATTESDEFYRYNYGRKTVHLAAPGWNIYSTVPMNQYAWKRGTSMACPHVAGAAALIWSKHPDWNYQKVKRALLETVIPVEDLRDKTITGGRLDILKALKWEDKQPSSAR
jgi:subtilisin family serine protease